MGRFSNLEEGYYKAVIQDWQLGAASTGTTQMAYFCKLLAWKADDGTWHDLDEEPMRTVYRYLTDNTADRFVADLKQLGYDKGSFAGLSKDADDAFDFAGIKVELHLHYEEYNGKEREKWEFAWNQGAGLGMGKTLDRKAVAALNTRYGERLKGLRAAPGESHGEPARTPEKPRARRGKDEAPPDDIPF